MIPRLSLPPNPATLALIALAFALPHPSHVLESVLEATFELLAEHAVG